MPIRVNKVAENLYEASASAPEWMGREEWSSPGSLDGKTLVEELKRKGFHIQDICDAIAEVDPLWMQKLTVGNRP